MTKTARARYTLEFKQEAVRLVTGGQSIAAAARTLGLGEQSCSTGSRRIAYPSNRSVRSHLVVVLTPNSDDLAGPSQGFEPILVEAFVPDLAVEALDAGGGGTHFPSTYPFNPSVLSIYNLGNDESGLAVYGFGSPTVEGVSWSANFVAAPVPEPSFYTMMLGGLMLCGVVARRRSS